MGDATFVEGAQTGALERGYEAFRAEVADWVRENFPEPLAGKNPQNYLTDGAHADADADFQLWLARVVEKGWGVPTWPVEYGGGGLDDLAGRIIAEEFEAAGAFNPVRSYGQMMLAPTLFEFGSEEQKQRFIPPIARGEDRWCQGFSEPGAGSDLASLRTKCVDAGDHWLVTGQKIWTSGANHADWCFCLVRTDTSSKQGGISFLLIDMHSEGVEARPIALINGVSHFCEVFFTDVAVPKENLVGEVNKGWTIAKRLLQFERDSLASGRAEPQPLNELARRYVGVDDKDRIADPDLRHRLIANAVRARAYQLTLDRAADEAKSASNMRTNVSSIVSALKNLGTDISQERCDLIMDTLGHVGLGWEGEHYAQEELEATRAWMHSRAYSIYGGSYEIQNNIIAKRTLGLPSE